MIFSLAATILQTKYHALRQIKAMLAETTHDDKVALTQETVSWHGYKDFPDGRF